MFVCVMADAAVSHPWKFADVRDRSHAGKQQKNRGAVGAGAVSCASSMSSSSALLFCVPCDPAATNIFGGPGFCSTSPARSRMMLRYALISPSVRWPSVRAIGGRLGRSLGWVVMSVAGWFDGVVIIFLFFVIRHRRPRGPLANVGRMGRFRRGVQCLNVMHVLLSIMVRMSSMVYAEGIVLFVSGPGFCWTSPSFVGSLTHCVDGSECSSMSSQHFFSCSLSGAMDWKGIVVPHHLHSAFSHRVRRGLAEPHGPLFAVLVVRI